MTEAQVDTRAVMKMGRSLIISLPKGFVIEHGIKKGDKVAVVWNGALRVIPADVARVKQ